MIHATDVRLGNWVYATDGSKRQITMESLLYLQAYPTNNQAEGIPLTEEILLKCGFKKINDSFRYVLNICEYEFWYYEIGVALSKIEICIHRDEYYVNNIYALHQLQNLYFALTGEELKITL